MGLGPQSFGIMYHTEGCPPPQSCLQNTLNKIPFTSNNVYSLPPDVIMVFSHIEYIYAERHSRSKNQMLGGTMHTCAYCDNLHTNDHTKLMLLTTIHPVVVEFNKIPFNSI